MYARWFLSTVMDLGMPVLTHSHFCTHLSYIFAVMFTDMRFRMVKEQELIALFKVCSDLYGTKHVKWYLLGLIGLMKVSIETHMSIRPDAW
jgi:hypothetical protein